MIYYLDKVIAYIEQVAVIHKFVNMPFRKHLITENLEFSILALLFKGREVYSLEVSLIGFIRLLIVSLNKHLLRHI